MNAIQSELSKFDKFEYNPKASQNFEGRVSDSAFLFNTRCNPAYYEKQKLLICDRIISHGGCPSSLWLLNRDLTKINLSPL
jgi:hypothetical protein